MKGKGLITRYELMNVDKTNSLSGSHELHWDEQYLNSLSGCRVLGYNGPLSFVYTRVFNVRLLHALAFSK